MFSIRLFGYDRSEVKTKVRRLQAQMKSLQESLNESETKASQLQAQLEDCSIRLSAVRRDRLQALASTATHQFLLVVRIGPVPSYAALVPLVEDLEQYAGLLIQFRVFRDGIYQINGRAEDVGAMIDWFKQHPQVRAVHREEDGIHVIVGE